jgi:hypothetical protein
MKRLQLLAVVLTSLATTSWAAQCDCQEKVGQCTGAVEVLRSFGSPPSYGAEIAIHSSEKVCSKVEFDVDGTPYQTVLANKNKDTESVFGTKPITASSVRYTACWVCKDTEAVEAKAAAPSSPWAGRWTQTDKNVFGFTNILEVNVKVNGDVVSGTITYEGKVSAIHGKVSGDQMFFTCSGCADNNWKMVDPETATYSWFFGSGTAKKQR